MICVVAVSPPLTSPLHGPQDAALPFSDSPPPMPVRWDTECMSCRVPTAYVRARPASVPPPPAPVSSRAALHARPSRSPTASGHYPDQRAPAYSAPMAPTASAPRCRPLWGCPTGDHARQTAMAEAASRHSTPHHGSSRHGPCRPWSRQRARRSGRPRPAPYATPSCQDSAGQPGAESSHHTSCSVPSWRQSAAPGATAL